MENNTIKKDIELKINSLSDSELIEACGFFLSDYLKIQSLSDIDNIIRREELVSGDFDFALEQLSEDREEYKKLLRFILLSSLKENESRVKLGIEGVGQKQGITEIAIILSLAMAFIIKLYQMKQTKSIESKEEVFEIKRTSEGYTMIYRGKTVYSNSESGLGKLLELILKSSSNTEK